MNWRLRAACLDKDPALFFAAEGEKPDAREAREEEARTVCRGCVVRDTCLDFCLGFVRQIDDAIWAGFNGPERRELRNAWLKREQRRQQRGRAA